MRTIFRLAALSGLMLAQSPLLAGPGELVELRVLDAGTGNELVHARLGPEQRIEFAGAADEPRYVGLRPEQFRGQAVLELSLADNAETWESAGFVSQDHPGVHQFDDLWLEIVPAAWPERFCAALGDPALAAERAPALSLLIDGEMYLSAPDWDGRSAVDLLALGDPEADPAWQAQVDEQGLLGLREVGNGGWRSVGPPRDDFPMIRRLEFEHRRMVVSHEPENYAQRFCGRLAARGEGYAERVTAHFLGRETGTQDSP